MRSLSMAMLMFLACGYASAECEGDPVSAFRAYEVALSAMKTHDDASILPHLTSSATATFNEMVSRRVSTVAMMKEKGFSAERAERMFSAPKKTARGSNFEHVKLEPRTSPMEAILSSTVEGGVTEEIVDGVKETTRSERVTRVVMRCEGGWKLQEENSVGILYSVKTDQNGRVIGTSKRGDGFGWVFP